MENHSLSHVIILNKTHNQDLNHNSMIYQIKRVHICIYKIIMLGNKLGIHYLLTIHKAEEMISILWSHGTKKAFLGNI